MAVSSRGRTGIGVAIVVTVVLIFVVAITMLWGSFGEEEQEDSNPGTRTPPPATGTVPER